MLISIFSQSDLSIKDRKFANGGLSHRTWRAPAFHADQKKSGLSGRDCRLPENALEIALNSTGRKELW